jgi:hypothetical protein
MTSETIELKPNEKPKGVELPKEAPRGKDFTENSGIKVFISS